MADCCRSEQGCYVCRPYTIPEPKSLWGDYCMRCNNDWSSPESCKHCMYSYSKKKARGELPRRREAILATREALSATHRR